MKTYKNLFTRIENLLEDVDAKFTEKLSKDIDKNLYEIMNGIVNNKISETFSEELVKLAKISDKLINVLMTLDELAKQERKE
jgi:hypothetical protein